MSDRWRSARGADRMTTGDRRYTTVRLSSLPSRDSDSFIGTKQEATALCCRRWCEGQCGCITCCLRPELGHLRRSGVGPDFQSGSDGGTKWEMFWLFTQGLLMSTEEGQFHSCIMTVYTRRLFHRWESRQRNGWRRILNSVFVVHRIRPVDVCM